MSEQIKFFRKNAIDKNAPNPILTVTDLTATNDGAGTLEFLRNRKNTSGFATTGSNDAANTQIDINLGDYTKLTNIILLLHNFKAYTIQYKDKITNLYTDFSTAINETINAESTTGHEFTEIFTTHIRIIITGTFVVDDDKFMTQLILTNGILAGEVESNQLEGWPQMQKPTHKKIKKNRTMLSGKMHLTDQEGAFEVDLDIKFLIISNDLFMFEDLFEQREGVLVWPGGGDETQFSNALKGYRKQDIFLMRPSQNYSNPFVNGQYKLGNKIKIRLTESII